MRMMHAGGYSTETEGSIMRIVFCGSSAVALPTLEALGEAGHEIAMVVTQPPRRAGRGGKVTATAVAVRAGAAGLNVIETADINTAEMVAAIGRTGAELIVVVDFGQMIRQAARDAVGRGAINMHASLLPALRGAAPINWAILRGLSRTGVTTFSLVDKMDAGAILLQEALDIDPEETAEDLRRHLAALGAEVVLRTVAGLAEGTLTPREQDEAAACLSLTIDVGATYTMTSGDLDVGGNVDIEGTLSAANTLFVIDK